MAKNDVCFIRAKQKHDYVFSAIERYGYNIHTPYREYNVFFRVCREIWFRLNLPMKKLWINSKVKRIDEKVIIVKDPLIIPDFLKNLRSMHPNKKIVLDYDNRVNNSVNPSLIREYVDEIWSYDEDDCMVYGLRFKGQSYLDIYKVEDYEPKIYDVVYVGRDKGRLNLIEKVQKGLCDAGFKVYFHICASRRYLTWSNKKYKSFLPYEDYLEILKKSRAILNIVPPGQRSITLREMETVFDGVKCITNNEGIKNFKFYDPTRYYLILDNNISYFDIKKFLETPFNPILESELNEYKFENRLLEMVKNIE